MHLICGCLLSMRWFSVQHRPKGHLAGKLTCCCSGRLPWPAMHTGIDGIQLRLSLSLHLGCEIIGCSCGCGRRLSLRIRRHGSRSSTFNVHRMFK